MTLRIDLEGFEQVQGIGKAVTNAVRKAGGDALRFLRAGSSRLVRQRRRFKAGDVRDAMALHYPRNGSDLEGLVWTLDVSGRKVPLRQFPHRQNAQGERVEINVGHPTFIRSAFEMVSTRSAFDVIAKRQGKDRLPIKELYGPSVADSFKDESFVQVVSEGTGAKFQQSFDRLFPLEMEKQK